MAGSGGGGFLGIGFCSVLVRFEAIVLKRSLANAVGCGTSAGRGFNLAPAAKISPKPLPRIGLGLLSMAEVAEWNDSSAEANGWSLVESISG